MFAFEPQRLLVLRSFKNLPGLRHSQASGSIDIVGSHGHPDLDHTLSQRVLHPLPLTLVTNHYPRR
jgi:hypothetical protein